MADIYLELVGAKVAPADRPYEAGIEIVDGVTRPFIVERSWIGPMGHYWERWSIRRDGGEVILQGQPTEIFVKGFQSIRTFSDRIDTPVRLEPGKYELAFYIENIYMGSADIQASPAKTAAA